ncbi:MAG: hypothetical protein ABWZ40_03700 [Caulobacterales bacterium]
MATPPGKVPIAESAAAGLKFLADNWQKLLPGSALMGVLSAAYFLVGSTAGAGGQSLELLVTLAFLVGLILVSASFYRLALRNEFPGASGLKFGADEKTFFGASLWSSLPIFAILAPSIIGFFMLFTAAAQKSGYTLDQLFADEKLAQEALAAQGGGGGVSLLFLISLVVVLWLFARLSLAVPASMNEGKIKVWSTFAWTKGNVWRIFAAQLLLWAPLFILAQVVVSIFSLALGINPGEAQAGKIAASPTLAIYGFVNGATSTLLITAPITGLLAFLYKGLRPST